MSEIVINTEGINHIEFFGINNAKFNMVKQAFSKLKINARGNQIKAEGADADLKLFEEKAQLMLDYLDRYGKLTERKILDILSDIEHNEQDGVDKYSDDVMMHGPTGTVIKAKTPGQKKMLELAIKNDIVFSVGPAGTGKTYTAVALAVLALKNKEVRRIILTRPAVEAGEHLGFLPGDMKDKIDPYLRPLYDALDDMIPYAKLEHYMSNRTIEIAPLAFMRGRTLDKAFVILDEAQNATEAQLKMFLTRLGPSAKCIVTGDLTQIDLPKSQQPGLIKALNILKDIKGIGIVYLNDKDVIRHHLVREIINAYERTAENRILPDQ